MLLATTLPARADEPASPAPVDPAVADTAEQFGIDPIDLQGAVISTGLDPDAYLCSVGEGPCPSIPVWGAVSKAECIMSEESGGLDVPNRQGSGAWGPGQYFPGTWSRHTALYRQATGYVGPLSLHSYADVLRVMSWILAAIPSSRGEWAVRGC